MRYIAASFQDVLDSRRRRPAYKIYAWDPGTVTISEIASAPGNLHASIPMPMAMVSAHAHSSNSSENKPCTYKPSPVNTTQAAKIM